MPLRRRKVTEEQATPPPPRPLIWPWLALLLLLVVVGIAAAYLATRDEDSGTAPPAVTRGPAEVEVPSVVGLSVDEAFVRLQAAGFKGQTVKIASSRPKDRVIRQSPRPGAKMAKGTAVLLMISKGSRAAAVVVPRVVGLTEAFATARLDRLDFQVSVTRIASNRPRGTVLSQEPPPGTRLSRGSVVGINVSLGTTTTTTAPTTTMTTSGTPVPNVVGLSQRDAVARLQRAGLRVDSYPAASSRPRGTVVAQRPPGGTRVRPKSLVRIDVSLGAGERPLRTVPDVVGMTESEAKQALVETGFTVRSVDQPVATLTEKDVVLDQKPRAGERASAGSQIAITVGRVPSSSG